MDSVDTGTLVPSQSRYITEQLEPGTDSRTAPIPGQLVAPPLATESGSRPNVSLATESGQALPLSVADAQTPPPIELHVLGLADGEQGVGDESVIAEHRVVVSPSHPDSVEPRTKTVGDVLRHAALIIEERGWTTLRYEWDGAVCAVGALGVAYAGDPEYDASPDVTTDARWWRTLMVLNDHLGQHPADFNDAPGRTAAEVISALRAAADESNR